MNFQLSKLIIWPKNSAFPPNEVQFKTGVVNVITGSSRTGKSAIIPIIDYCLASGDCNIPIDTIRDYVSWYGILVQTDTEQLLFCRKVPDGNKPSSDFYFQRGTIVSVPNLLNEGNEKLDGIKQILNSISGVPYFNLDEEKNSYKSRLSFRDLMALVFQSQEIVANQNILFYKTHAHEHREKLRNWFPFILGAETTDILIARQRLQLIQQKLSQLRKEFGKAKNISLSWMANIIGHLKVAQEYGLLKEPLPDNSTPDELAEITKSILEFIPDFSESDLTNIELANKEFEELEKKENELSAQIGLLKKRLVDLSALKSGFLDYGNSVKKRVERLHISQWLKEVSTHSESCPACGSTGHPNSSSELDKIANVFEQYEIEAKKVQEIPTSFYREEESLKRDLAELIEQKKSYQARFDLLLARDKEAQEQFQRRKNMYLFLGHLKASYENFEKLIDGGEFELEINALEKEEQELLKIVDIEGVHRRVAIATSRISSKILHHLKTLDVEEKYREIEPKFDIENLSISVLSNSEHWYFLAQVGSASNWVSFHIALMCALQEYFLSLKQSCVPNFVIFDQPSQVYFPKLKRGQLESQTEIKYEDNDVEAVKDIFRTISNSIIAQNGSWQALILDHADDSIYSDILGVHQVDEWRGGKKLIPLEWME